MGASASGCLRWVSAVFNTLLVRILKFFSGASAATSAKSLRVLASDCLCGISPAFNSSFVRIFVCCTPLGRGGAAGLAQRERPFQKISSSQLTITIPLLVEGPGLLEEGRLGMKLLPARGNFNRGIGGKL